MAAADIYARVHGVCFGPDPQRDVIDFMQPRGLISRQEQCNNCHGVAMAIKSFKRCKDGYIWRCPEKKTAECNGNF